MSFEDKSIQCSDCGANFTFTVGEQEFFAGKGFTNEPKRCPECRQTRKTQQYGNSGNSGNGYGNQSFSYRPQRQMFPAVCAECGRDTEVPFEPRGDRPVYCSDCYRKVKIS